MSVDNFVAILADNQIVTATANFFGIVAGIIILWKFVKLFFVFFKNVYHKNVLYAVKVFRNSHARASFYCAKDIHVFLSLLINYLCLVFFCISGMIFIVFSNILKDGSGLGKNFAPDILGVSHGDFASMFSSFQSAANLAMVFLLFASSLPVSNLALNVRKIRIRWRKRGRLK